MRVLVTGATGFIGLGIVERLLKGGHKVVSVVRRESKRRKHLPEHPLHTVIERNIPEYDDLASEISGEIDCAVHLSWNGTRGADRDDPVQQRLNHDCSIGLVRWLADTGCKKIFLAGSQAEYGQREGLLSEDMVCSPVTEYGKTKLRIYQDALNICEGRHVTLIEPRYFSVYGARDDKSTMVITTLKKMMDNQDCEFTKAVQMWDFLYIDDAIEALYGLITADCESGIYNFGSGDTRQLKSFILEMKEAAGSESKLIFGAVPYHEKGMVSIAPDVTKLKSSIGWEPKVTFSEGIKRIALALKEE